MKRNINVCKSCYQLENCTLYHKALENGTKESSGIGALFDELTSHLTQHHLNYFLHWDKLIELEEAEMYKYREEVWSISGQEREKTNGRCFNDMMITEQLGCDKGFLYRFQKESTIKAERNQDSSSIPITSLLDMAISSGDYIVLSTIYGHFGISSGFVKEVFTDSVIIHTEDELRPPPAPVNENSACLPEVGHQIFHGIVEIEDIVSPRYKRKKAEETEVPGWFSFFPNQTGHVSHFCIPMCTSAAEARQDNI